MTTKRVMWVAGTAAALYIAVAYWVITNFEIPPLSNLAVAVVLVAAVCQIAAMWFFGLLFRESIQESGKDIPPWQAFKAALVGAGIARLIPAGGAMTPVGMAWTVRDKTRRSTAGPALRTVLLNYAGLLIMTGLGLLFARPLETAEIGGFSVSLVILAPVVLGFGMIIMFGSGRLGTISKYLPRFVRDKVRESMVNHFPKLESQVYVWARLGLEAAALYLVLLAFGIRVDGFQVMAAFGGSALIGGLPGTPGGAGITELGLAGILAAYGFPAATTVVPILVFRVISYWLPAGLGFWAGGSTFLGSEEAKAADSTT